MNPNQYECNDCKACWAEYKAKRCIDCLGKNIKVIWSPNEKKDG